MNAALGHKLLLDGPLGSHRWRCECGKWQKATPALGPFGRTSMRARMAQLTMAHDKHVKHTQNPAATFRRA